MKFLANLAYVSVWTNIPVFLMIACYLTASYTTASPNYSSNAHAKLASTKRIHPSRRGDLNDPTEISTNNSSNSTLDVSAAQADSAINHSSLLSNSSLNSTDSFADEDFLADDGLLTDPAHPVSGTPTASTQISSKPTAVTSSLLTAVTPAPSLERNSSTYEYKNQTHYSDTITRTPVLNGSMTIDLPTRTGTAILSRPSQPSSNTNSSISSSTNTSASSADAKTATNNPSVAPTGTVIIDQPSTPTTSTAIVYATGAPVSNRPAPKTNSFGYRNLPSSLHRFGGLGLIVLSIVN